MPELESIQLGEDAFFYTSSSASTTLIMKSGGPLLTDELDLPKLKTLVNENETGSDDSSFRNVQSIILESSSFLIRLLLGMPNLSLVVLTKNALRASGNRRVNSRMSE